MMNFRYLSFFESKVGEVVEIILPVFWH